MTQRALETRFMYGGQTSAYDTAATPATVLAKVQGFTPINDSGTIYDYGLGEGDYPQTPVYGPYTCGGTLNFNITDFDFLKHWIGPKSGAGTSGNKYTLTEDNVIGLTTSDIQPFTLEVANISESTDTVDTYIGCVGNDFTISADLGLILRCSASFVARLSDPGTSATSYTPSTTTPFIMINGSVQWGGTPSAVSGIQDFSITHTNAIDPSAARDVTSRFIGMPYVGQKRYTFRYTIKMAQAIASSIVDHFYGTAGSGPESGSTATSPTSGVEFKIEVVNGSRNATIHLDECTIDRIEKAVQVGNGLVLLTVSGTSRGGKSGTPIQWWS